MKKLDTCYETDVMENIFDFDGQTILPLDEEFLISRFKKLDANTNKMITVMRKISGPKTIFISDASHKERIESSRNAKMRKYFHDMGIHSMKGIDGTNVNIDNICMFADATTFMDK